MTLRTAWTGHPGRVASIAALLVSVGCSLFYQLNTTQCENDSDCAGLGFRVATACVNRVCVPKSVIGGTGGTDTGGEGGTGATGATGGQGGSGGQAECRNNKECIEGPKCAGQACMCINGTCQTLISDDCPLILPTAETYSPSGATIIDLLNQPGAILLGGYAAVFATASPLLSSNAAMNWDLAFGEFNYGTSGGLTGGTRPLLALVCDSQPADNDSLLRSLGHLTQDLRVPGILTTLDSNRLKTVFNATDNTVGDPPANDAYAKAGGKPVFFMNTGSISLDFITNITTNGLAWHMLGNPRVLAATSNALLQKITQHVQDARTANFNATGVDDPATPLRVTMISSDEASVADIAQVLAAKDPNHPESTLTFNQQAAADQLRTASTAGNFGWLRNIPSGAAGSDPAIQTALTDIKTNPPHVIVAMATSEFAISMLNSIELSWGASGSASVNQIRPYYILSHRLWNNGNFTIPLRNHNTKTPPLGTRIVGVNFAQAQDTHSQAIFSSYFGRLSSLFSTAGSGLENYYDGAYLLLYSVAAAVTKNPAIDGTAIYQGFEQRVIVAPPTGQTVYLDPSTIASTVSQLKLVPIQLWGAMGAPNFDTITGSRVVQTSAWCINWDTTALPAAAPAFHADGLLYDATNKTFYSPGNPPDTALIPVCLQGY
jgi:hypothetical protein